MNPNTAPRHPGVDTALTIDDVRPGVNYVTFVPGGSQAVERGEFTSEPDYDEHDSRWTASARIKLGQETVEKVVYLYDAGIAPDGDGESWAPTVTIEEDLE